MLINYCFGGTSHSLTVNWTDELGRSVIYQEICKRLAAQHGAAFIPYLPDAVSLDSKVDKLYGIISTLTNEHAAAPYNPTLAHRMTKSVAELDVHMKLCCSGDDRVSLLLGELFEFVLNKLRETVDVFLQETKYRSKHHWRKRRKEQSVEVTDEGQMSFEFEDILVTMTDLSCMLDCLTDKQRTRLVQHVFLKYSFQEIADQEGVGKSKISKSVSVALVKLKNRLI